MTDTPFFIELEGDQPVLVEADDAAWLKDRVGRAPGPTRLNVRYDESDTEGHTISGTLLRVIVETDDTDDTEGHVVSLRFPTAQDADAFRKRLLVTGVLAGTIALGAAGGIGLATMTDAGSSRAVAGSAATGSAWTSDERPLAATAMGAGAGSAWIQDERPADAAAAAAVSSDGGAWTQDERQSETAPTGADAPGRQSDPQLE